jgi:uncharacterized RDD family membrane protein YckC
MSRQRSWPTELPERGECFVRKRYLRVTLSGLLFLAAAVVIVGCTDATTLPTNLPVPGTYLRDDIPMPILDSAVGWYQYLGNGRFSVESGREFFWRDGRFVNAPSLPS